MLSSTTRKRPAVSVTAATVTSGVRGMQGIIAVGGATVGETSGRQSAAACDAQAVLDRARVPHLIEFLQIQPGGHRVVDVGDTVPAVGAHTVDDRTVVGDEIRGGALWRLGGHVADVEGSWQPPAHC